MKQIESSIPFFDPIYKTKWRRRCLATVFALPMVIGMFAVLGACIFLFAPIMIATGMATEVQGGFSTGIFFLSLALYTLVCVAGLALMALIDDMKMTDWAYGAAVVELILFTGFFTEWVGTLRQVSVM